MRTSDTANPMPNASGRVFVTSAVTELPALAIAGSRRSSDRPAAASSSSDERHGGRLSTRFGAGYAVVPTAFGPVLSGVAAVRVRWGHLACEFETMAMQFHNWRTETSEARVWLGALMNVHAALGPFAIEAGAGVGVIAYTHEEQLPLGGSVVIREWRAVPAVRVALRLSLPVWRNWDVVLQSDGTGVLASDLGVGRVGAIVDFAPTSFVSTTLGVQIRF